MKLYEQVGNALRTPSTKVLKWLNLTKLTPISIGQCEEAAA